MVILLQLYRLYVVHTENSKAMLTGGGSKKKSANGRHRKKNNDLSEMNQFNDIYIISSGKFDKKRGKKYVIVVFP